MTARPNIARINITGHAARGRSMRSKSAQRERSLAHVPPAQQRAGVVGKKFATGGRAVGKAAAPSSTSARTVSF
jgi:hypothetical protein